MCGRINESKCRTRKDKLLKLIARDRGKNISNVQQGIRIRITFVLWTPTYIVTYWSWLVNWLFLSIACQLKMDINLFTLALIHNHEFTICLIACQLKTDRKQLFAWGFSLCFPWDFEVRFRFSRRYKQRLYLHLNMAPQKCNESQANCLARVTTFWLVHVQKSLWQNNCLHSSSLDIHSFVSKRGSSELPLDSTSNSYYYAMNFFSRIRHFHGVQGVLYC